MAIVQQFDRQMIQRFLDGMKLHYLRDSDGDFIVQFGFDMDRGNELNVLLTASGSKNDVYSIYVESSNFIDAKDFDRAIRVCNTWNMEKRWPKSYLRIRQDGGRAYGRIMLEGQLDLEHGIHQELFDDFSGTTLAGASAFWMWAHREHGF